MTETENMPPGTSTGTIPAAAMGMGGDTRTAEGKEDINFRKV